MPGAKRYYRLEGVDIGERSPHAVRVKVGGLWHWVPLSVVHSETKKIGELEKDELMIDEWFANFRGWA